MIDLSSGVDSLTNFKRNTTEMVNQLEESGEAMVLTVNGRAKIVVQDVASYQRLLAKAERADMIEGLKEAIESMNRGEGVDFSTGMDKLRRKHKIPRKS